MPLWGHSSPLPPDVPSRGLAGLCHRQRRGRQTSVCRSISMRARQCAQHGAALVLWAAQLCAPEVHTHDVLAIRRALLCPCMCARWGEHCICMRWRGSDASASVVSPPPLIGGQGGSLEPQLVPSCPFPPRFDPGVLSHPWPPIPGLRPDLGGKLPGMWADFRSAPLEPFRAPYA